MKKEQVLAAAQMAAMADVDSITCDRVEALTGGHGMLNMSIYAVTNVIAQELLNGGDISVKFANVRHLPVEDIMKKAIDAAKAAGSDGANAALVAATIMYLCGSAAQVGIPAGNRKLGATARMLAGVDRCGVAAVPTAKMNNKLSAFPAVAAVYQAMRDGTLCDIKGENVPVNVSGGPVYGHSALGEDFVWPQLAANGGRIGTQAMIDAMNGAAMHPQPFTCALLGSAAILEIIHPDAEVPEGRGTYGRTTSVYLVGESAVATAGLPEKLHVKITGEEIDTAKLVGDLALILKDIGGVSVIGMMAFDEILSIFEEGVMGFSGGPLNAPLGHIGGYCMIALKMLLQDNVEAGGDPKKRDYAAIAKKIADDCFNTKMDGETGLVSINTVTRKSLEVTGGPVTRVLLDATEPMKAKAIYRRTETAYEMLSKGASVEEVARFFDNERLAIVEAGANRVFSEMLGGDFKIKITKLGKGARRTSKLACKYWSFDSVVDAEVTFNGETYIYEGFCHDLVPQIAKGGRADLAPMAPLVAAVASELMLAGNTILNCTIPAAVAVAMGVQTPVEASALAEQGAYITIGIPGGKASALAVSKAAKNMIDCITAED